jgi:hypothetical protein
MEVRAHARRPRAQQQATPRAIHCCNRGTPNKKTALKNAAFAAAAANPAISPLEFLLGVIRDPNISLELRVKVAQAAAPFVHAKPGNALRAIRLEVQSRSTARGPFTIDPAVAKALRDDYERLETTPAPVTVEDAGNFDGDL